ncbi:MAG: hypothetical protein KDC61_11445 [Saprospiraceae bacterium]|nr:hypothetical protein [Saprospiraceae bacterium]MCB0542856.1 hypothetical protein [Saprospiraceae bacterium]MCB0575165.1 hypothetical protein [Saprospiraceae bacterium]
MKTFFCSFKPGLLMLCFGFVLVSAMTTFQACSPAFDQAGLDNVTNLGSKLTDLMAKATEPYGKHEVAVNALRTELGLAAEHAASQKRNKEIAEAWMALKNELATPFFDRWKEKGLLNIEVIKESVGQVGKSIDAIKKAELAKRK